MQESCQICEQWPGRIEHWLYGLVCAFCCDRLKWARWHEGITPVRGKE